MVDLDFCSLVKYVAEGYSAAMVFPVNSYSQPPPSSIPNDLTEPTKIASFIFALGETERLFVQVAEQVIWFNKRVRALQRAFQQPPEVL